MRCPNCQQSTRVTDSRERDDYIYRRRKCLACEQRFSSEERLVVRCPICGHYKTKAIDSQNTPGLRRCDGCGMSFIDEENTSR